MIVWKLAISPVTATSASTRVFESGAEDGLKAEKQGLVRGRDFGCAGSDAGAQDDGEEGAGDQRQQPIENAARHVLLRVVALFSGQRQLLDAEVEP